MITGITRVRNESLILEDTLRHFLKVCESVLVYDDCSTDNTVEIARSFDGVAVIEGDHWREDRIMENTRHRRILLDKVQTDWVLCFDADERLADPLPPLRNVDGYRLRLFDGYMVEGSEPYTGGKLIDQPRMWGPEYRDIVMLFRRSAASYHRPGMRAPDINGHVKQANTRIKHYGKCLSVEQWEETCDYYLKYFPRWRSKWLARKGGAIHTQSDWGRSLLTWGETLTRGIPL